MSKRKQEPVGVCLKDSDAGGQVAVQLTAATLMLDGKPYPISDIHLRMFTTGAPVKAGQPVGLLDDGTVVGITPGVVAFEGEFEVEEEPELGPELERLGGELERMKLP